VKEIKRERYKHRKISFLRNINLNNPYVLPGALVYRCVYPELSSSTQRIKTNKGRKVSIKKALANLHLSILSVEIKKVLHENQIVCATTKKMNKACIHHLN